MSKDVRVRLYVSLVVVTIAVMYIGPLLVLTHGETVRSEFLQNCTKESPAYWDLCWQQSKEKASLSFWKYLLPYLPVALLIWANWLAKPDLRLSAQSFPRKTVNSLVWLGLVAAVFGAFLPLWWGATQKLSDFEGRGVFILPWLSGTALAAPMVFNYLVGPVPSMINMRKAKIALLVLVAVPVVGLMIFLSRSMLAGE